MDRRPGRPREAFHCLVGIIDALGNLFLYAHTIPYDLDFKSFLQRLQENPFRRLLSIHDESDYANWAKRLDFLSSDKMAIAEMKRLIEKHRDTDYEKLAEWLWICKDQSGGFGGIFITGEKEFKALMALAKTKKLGRGCLMRLSESKFHEISAALKNIEMKEDHKGLEKFEEAFCEMERRQRQQVQEDGATDDAHADKEPLDWGSEDEHDPDS